MSVNGQCFSYVQAGQLLKIYNFSESKLSRLKEVKSTKDSIALVERNMIRDSLVAKLVMNLLNYDSIAKKLSKNYLTRISIPLNFISQ